MVAKRAAATWRLPPAAQPAGWVLWGGGGVGMGRKSHGKPPNTVETEEDKKGKVL